MGNDDIAAILRRARETLDVAKRGLKDARDPARRGVALRNVVVFGRAVTNVVENLRSKVESFDEWYRPLSAQMEQDPLLKFFYRLRSEILKQGNLGTGSYAHIKSFSSADLAKIPKPRNAKSFFIGDRLGGSGWEVETSPGVTETYYINLPDSMVVTGMYFQDAPVPLEQRDAIKLCEHYVQRMEEFVRAAEERWRRKE